MENQLARLLEIDRDTIEVSESLMNNTSNQTLESHHGFHKYFKTLRFLLNVKDNLGPTFNE